MNRNDILAAAALLLFSAFSAFSQFPAGMQMVAHSRSTPFVSARPYSVLNQEITFSEHIAPVIWRNCVGCHRTGEVAPFTLTSYQDVAKRASMVASVIQSRYMPPWKPAQGYGHFADSRGLTQDEIDLIAQWADAGAPEGDPTQTPPLPKFPSGSQLGEPDLVLKMQQSWQVKGDYKDVYRNFVLPTGLLQDRTVAAIEFRPGNPKVVHHALIFLDTSGTGRKLDANDADYGYVGFGGPGFTPAKNMLGWVPGSVARFFPTGLGITMFKHSDIVVQIHYAPSASEEIDLSSINIFFSKQNVNREIQQAAIAPQSLISGQFVIPANHIKKFVGRIPASSITTDISVLAVAPHMHLLGKNCKSYAITPKGDTIKLIQIDDWDFHWQGYYMMKNLVKLPKGSALYYEAEYDNTSANPENPNSPPKELRWGESTFDEMFLCYYLYSLYRPGDENISMETQIPTGTEKSGGSNSSGLKIEGIYPNPVTGQSVIEYSSPHGGDITLEITDIMGIPQHRQLIVSKAGHNAFRLPELPLAAGVYYCRIMADTGEMAAATFFVVR